MMEEINSDEESLSGNLVSEFSGVRSKVSQVISIKQYFEKIQGDEFKDRVVRYRIDCYPRFQRIQCRLLCRVSSHQQLRKSPLRPEVQRHHPSLLLLLASRSVLQPRCHPFPPAGNGKKLSAGKHCSCNTRSRNARSIRLTPACSASPRSRFPCPIRQRL